ncbi:hypothetical protein D039_0825A, partial [Vibrio parahaemolyticus EKP-028]
MVDFPTGLPLLADFIPQQITN